MRRQRLPLPERPPGPAWKPWFQLAFLVFALVALLVMMSRIGDTSAGCFMILTEEQAAESVEAR